jgi:hypothetical protein
MSFYFSLPLRIPAVLFSLIALASAARAQSPTTTPSPHPSQSPKFTQQQMQEMVAKLQERIGKAADQVMGRIRTEEGNIYRSFSSFRKPERLNPATYTSKDDVNEWMQSLQQLKGKEENLQKLYANADPDLANALLEQRINQAIAEQIKKELLQTFPWDVIKRKDQLMKEFISQVGELLEFYNKNWGLWKADPTSHTTTFDDPKLASGFQYLKDKINATGLQIEDQYKEMMR